MVEKINIRGDAKDWRAKILSNLAYTPFQIGEFIFPCVEAPLQGIKFRDLEERKKVFKMNGIGALRMGRELTLNIKKGEANFVYWQNKRIIYNSTDHRLLIAMFIREKIRQNHNVQEALLATQKSFIFHDVGGESSNTSLPEKFFIEILLRERQLLIKLQTLSLAP